MRPASQDLAKLPGIEANIRLVRAVDRSLHDHRRRAVTRSGRAAIHQPPHIRLEAGHIERPVLHPDIDVIGPGAGVVAPLLMGQHVAAMLAVVINRLPLLQQFDGSVDTVRHVGPPVLAC